MPLLNRPLRLFSRFTLASLGLSLKLNGGGTVRRVIAAVLTGATVFLLWHIKYIAPFFTKGIEPSTQNGTKYENTWPPVLAHCNHAATIELSEGFKKLTIVQSVSASYANDSHVKRQIESMRCYARRHGFAHHLHVLAAELPDFFCERHTPVLQYFGESEHILFVSTDMLIEPASDNLETILNSQYDVKLPLRENNEVNTEAYFLRGDSAFAKCFLESWILKSCRSGNVDQGSLNELLLELAAGSAVVEEGKSLREHDYNRWLSEIFSNHLDKVLRLRCSWPILVTPPILGYMKSLECYDSTDLTHWFFNFYEGSPFNHGCKQMLQNYGTDDENNMSCNTASGPRLGGGRRYDAHVNLSYAKRLVAQQCDHGLFPFFAYMAVCAAPDRGLNICMHGMSPGCLDRFKAMQTCEKQPMIQHKDVLNSVHANSDDFLNF